MSDIYPVPLPSPKPLWRRWGVLPNTITLLRVIGCFVPMWMIMDPRDHMWPYVWPLPLAWWVASIIVLLIVASTDFADGLAARLTDSVTKFGEKFDPIADKLLVIPTFFAVCWVGLIVPPWGWTVFTLSVIPEVVLVSLNIYLMIRSIDARIPSIWPGKVKMWVQCTGLLIALIPIPGMWWQIVVITVFTIGIVFSCIAANSYIRTGLTYLNPAQ